MLMNHFITLFSLSILLVACNAKETSKDQKSTDPAPTNVSELDKLKSDVMEIHDESMKYMTDIKKAKKALLDTELMKGKDKNEIEKTSVYLENADSLMMNWMRNYKEPTDPDSLKIYLTTELEAIKKVDIAIARAMNRANKLLKQ